ncbi:MAG: DUF5320 domain-containing protein [Bacteroidales bacterium]|nr:DUF5320 domain-containing protein [Bacteroidales bacterium]
MKKLGMLIVVLIFAGTQFVMAQPQNPQPPQQPQQVSPVREYIQKNVLPVVEKEQSKLMAALTAEEKQELTKIKDQFKDLRPGPMGAPGAGMRGNFERPMMRNDRAEVHGLLDQAQKIADAHPKAAAAYKDAIEAMMEKWTKDINAIRDENAPGYGRGMNRNNKTPFILDRLSDPAFGLMFNGDLFPMNMKPGMRPGMGYGNYGRRGTFNGPMYGGMMCDYGRMGRNMGYRHQGMGRDFGRGCYDCYGMNDRYAMHRNFGGMMRAMNPETKKEVLAYAEKNIFPVLNEEREAFDKVLKNSEKKEIENARKNIADLRGQMKKYWENKPAGPGRGDSTRLALRIRMEKNMLALNEIVLNHFTELHANLDNLKEHMPTWREGMREVVFQNMKKEGFDCPMRHGYGRMMNRGGRMMNFNGNHRMITPGIRFLLYDPAHPGEHFFPLSNKIPTGENSK